MPEMYVISAEEEIFNLEKTACRWQWVLNGLIFRGVMAAVSKWRIPLMVHFHVSFSPCVFLFHLLNRKIDLKCKLVPVL